MSGATPQAAMDTPATKTAYAKTLQSSLGVANLEAATAGFVTWAVLRMSV